MEYKTVQRDKLVVTPLDSYKAGCLKVNNSDSLMKRTILHLISTFLVILCWKTVRKIRIKLKKLFFSSIPSLIIYQVNSFILVTNICRIAGNNKKVNVIVRSIIANILQKNY